MERKDRALASFTQQQSRAEYVNGPNAVAPPLKVDATNEARENRNRNVGVVSRLFPKNNHYTAGKPSKILNGFFATGCL
jgi:hypothetical protein